MKRKLFFLTFVGLLFGSCNSSNNPIKNSNGDLAVPDSVLNKGVLAVSEEAMQDIIENISSPIEIAALIKQKGVPFSKDYLASTEFVSKYNTSLEQALVLGVFGADLGYLNMYNKTGTVIDYISSIKSLADAISVGQFFDFNTLKRLATNNTNLDSLMYISIHSFNEMDKYLRKNNRANLGALIVTGVWLEGLYLSTQVSKKHPSNELREKIGEQKIILGDLMLILKNYSKDPQFKKILDDIIVIKNEFNDVKISYEMGEPEAIEQDGMLMIVQNEKSIVNITDETLKNIVNTTEKIRNKLISK